LGAHEITPRSNVNNSFDDGAFFVDLPGTCIPLLSVFLRALEVRELCNFFLNKTDRFLVVEVKLFSVFSSSFPFISTSFSISVISFSLHFISCSFLFCVFSLSLFRLSTSSILCLSSCSFFFLSFFMLTQTQNKNEQEIKCSEKEITLIEKEVEIKGKEEENTENNFTSTTRKRSVLFKKKLHSSRTSSARRKTESKGMHVPGKSTKKAPSSKELLTFDLGVISCAPKKKNKAVFNNIWSPGRQFLHQILS
jgi:hypothetical protein